MTFGIVTSTIIGVGSVLLLVGPYIDRKWRPPSHTRLLVVIGGVVGIAASISGLYYETHWSLLAYSQRWALNSIHMTLDGTGLGILIALVVISPELRIRLRDRSARNG